MGRYMQSTITQRFPCAYLCHKCRKPGLGIGHIMVSRQARYGAIGTGRQEAGSIASEGAQRAVGREMDKLIDKVNLEKNLSSLKAQAKCGQCGKTQIWAHAGRFGLLRLLLGGGFFALAVLNAEEVSDLLTGTNKMDTTIYLAAAALFAYVCYRYLGNFLINLLCKIVLNNTHTAECYPLITDGRPVQGSPRDVRVQILALQGMEKPQQ